MQPLVVFGDDRVVFSRLLVEGVCARAESLPDIRLAALCDTSPKTRSALLRHPLSMRLRGVLMRAFNPHLRGEPDVQAVPLSRLARRHGVPLLTPPASGVNHPAFLEGIGRLGKPFGITCLCMQIFRPQLLERFRGVVNYHNGLLPYYRGLRATSWSVYHGEDRTGFAFHWMTDGIDEGPVLLQDSVEVLPDRTLFQLELEKTALAIRRSREVLTMMAANVAGRPQAKGGKYFGKPDLRKITRIEAPSRLDSGEILLRLRAFGVLTVDLGEKSYEISHVEPASCPGAADLRLTFSTRDGKTFRPTRFRHFPLRLYRLFRRLSKAGTT